MDFFSTTAARSGLKTKTVRGAVVTGATQAIRVTVGLATIPLLARLLEPADFGLFATVGVITGFALMFVDAGLSMATIQRDEITRDQVSNLFWVSVGLSVVIAMIVSAIGPILGWLYNEPRLIWLTAACSLSYLFTGLTIQHQALLRRCMLFHRIAAIEIVAMIVGQAAAIGWAYRFYGQPLDYWALAMVPIGTSAARMIGVWVACRWVPHGFRRHRDTGEMLKFGGNLTSGMAFNYAGNHVDVMVVGYFFGDVLLGNYERSTMLSVQPMRQINGPLSAVCVPALSRLVDSPVAYHHAYRTAATLVSIVIVPIAAVCIVDAELLVGVLLGNEWSDAVPIFRVLSLGLITLPMCNASAWLLISQGRGRETFHFQAFDSILKMALVFAAIPWGVLGVTLACTTRAIVVAPLLFAMIGRHGPVTTRQIYRIFAVQLLAMAVASAALWMTRTGDATTATTSELFRSLVIALVISAVASSLVFVCFSFVRRGLADVVGSFSRFPRP